MTELYSFPYPGQEAGWTANCEVSRTDGIVKVRWMEGKLNDWAGIGFDLRAGDGPADLSRMDRGKCFLELDVEATDLKQVRASLSGARNIWGIALAESFRNPKGGPLMVPLSAMRLEKGRDRWTRIGHLSLSTWKLRDVKEFSLKVRFPVRIVCPPEVARSRKTAYHELERKSVLHAIPFASTEKPKWTKNVSVTPGEERVRVIRTGNAWAGLEIPVAGRGSIDLLEKRPGAYVAIPIRGEGLENLGIGFTDSFGRWATVRAFSRENYDEEAGILKIKLRDIAPLNWDRIEGFRIAVEESSDRIDFELGFPIEIAHTGRVDSRPADYAPAPKEATVKVDFETIIRDVSHHPVGMHHFSPLEREGAGRHDPAVFRDVFGVRYLRHGDPYYSFWSEPPWERARPVTIRRGVGAWPATDKGLVEDDGVHYRSWWLDFDEEIAMAKEARCESLIMLPYNSAYAPGWEGLIVPSLEDYIKASEEWVRYANVKKGYGVRYWEIGNEVWTRGKPGSITATQYAEDIARYSVRLKAVDPSVKITVSANSVDWLKKVLAAAEHIDYVNWSNYLNNYEEGYHTYRDERGSTLGNWIDELKGALAEAAPKHRDRIKAIATEFNACDWSKMWPNANGNDLGHALMVFQMAGDMLVEPFVHLAFFWTYQWVWRNEVTGWGPFVENPPSVFDAVDRNREVTATGRAVAIWGTNLLDLMAKSESTNPFVIPYATRDKDGGRFRIFLLNKDYEEKVVRIRIGNSSLSGGVTVRRHVFAGRGLEDPSPEWRETARESPAGKRFSVALPELSVTMLSFEEPSNARQDREE